ncbi:redoxin family protein [Flammeovirga yaeyamensis]|uniref:Redoxin family protein n=1 Tax=Flammeovirga yaeyamensis TaxID=367791 RepID=A0AAX1N8S2_9BACT|nr:TlpA disulfide reductase family protein [Flammeovirga yaeyamensis]MBB3698729.1 thiol-disulfide isomerase/thioredoxin/outer membrane lipoprotein-sorting protein [Flammeovirga yaeyamensis]NMF37315.1 TlpA family protein disulfide reductase [Flammeovirga yaeyamensis]QWG03867.1 redoxin family protein [Flammeovirga yaeyamensis]
MKRITFLIILAFLSSCSTKPTTKDFLSEVLTNLEGIESVSYISKEEGWLPSDTVPSITFSQYTESYRNPSDSTIGSKFLKFDTKDKKHLKVGYDGEMQVSINDESKFVVQDKFDNKKMTFRVVIAPFYNYNESIIRYILNNNDSTSLIKEDLDDEIHIKLTINEDNFVEFFGKPEYLPPYSELDDPTSIYEIWIDKKTKLPTKVRREMSHDITVSKILDYDINKLDKDKFNMTNHYPNDYAVFELNQLKNFKDPQVLLGKKAPDWILENDKKQSVSLSELNSKVVLLQFTSVTCAPCKKSIPYLEKLSKDYPKNDFDLVAIECSSDNLRVIDNYIHKNNFNYKFLMSSKDIMKDYSVSMFPVFFILDENKTVKKVIRGFGGKITDQEIRNEIENMI